MSICEGGVCLTHGRGARRTWKPTGRKITVVGADGKKKTTSEREYSYKFDVGPMRQMQLSFSRTTARTTTDNKDTFDEKSVVFGTSKVGQSQSNSVQAAGKNGRFSDEI